MEPRQSTYRCGNRKREIANTGVVADGSVCHGLCGAQPAPSRPAAKRYVRSEMEKTREADIARFVVPAKRERVAALLTKIKSRKKIVDGLDHFTDFDPRYIIPIPTNQQTEQGIVELL